MSGNANGVEVGAIGDCHSANFPMDDEGKVYHLAVKKGDVANRILTSGDVERIRRIATSTPGFHVLHDHKAPRLFEVYTGTYKGVEVSLVASLMGIANMDFTIRELRHVVDGPMAVIRFGTCGTPQESIDIGDICIANEGYMVLRNPDSFNPRVPEDKRPEPYTITGSFPTDSELTELLKAKVLEHLPAEKVHVGSNASADSFYGAQGRITEDFKDCNEKIVEKMLEKHPDTCIIEMESAHMMHLAECATVPIHTAACAVVLAQRKKDQFLDQETKHQREVVVGISALDAITEFKM